MMPLRLSPADARRYLVVYELKQRFDGRVPERELNRVIKPLVCSQVSRRMAQARAAGVRLGRPRKVPTDEK